MSHHGKAAARLLQQGLIAHPKLPLLTQHVMRVLSSGPDIATAWKELGEDERTVNRVVSMVRQSLSAALKEAARPSRSEERADLDSVIKQLRTLQSAIRMVMPADQAQLFTHELHAEGLPSVPLALGWHSLKPENHPIGYRLTIHDVLGWAVQMTENLTDNLPIRAAVRESDDTKVTVFVRHLAWHFHREFGQEKRGTIARITSAIFDLKAPLDGKDVERRLESRPDSFKPPR